MIESIRHDFMPCSQQEFGVTFRTLENRIEFYRCSEVKSTLVSYCIHFHMGHQHREGFAEGLLNVLTKLN